MSIHKVIWERQSHKNIRSHYCRANKNEKRNTFVEKWRIYTYFQYQMKQNFWFIFRESGPVDHVSLLRIVKIIYYMNKKINSLWINARTFTIF